MVTHVSSASVLLLLVLRMSTPDVTGLKEGPLTIPSSTITGTNQNDQIWGDCSAPSKLVKFKQQPSSRKTYTKTNHSKSDGEDYEIYMIILLALRCLMKGWKFTIGSNMKIAHPFDDIVLATNDGSQAKVWALQLKHVLSKNINVETLTNEKSGFSIKHCMKNVDAVKIQSFVNHLEEPFRTNSIMYGLYTIQATDILEVNPHSSDCILNTGGSIASFNETENKGIYKQLNELEVTKIGEEKSREQFFNRFRLFVAEAQVKQTESYVETAIAELIGNDINSATLRSILYEDFKEWWGTKENPYLITDTDDIWNRFTQTVADSVSESIQCSLKFTEESLGYLGIILNTRKSCIYSEISEYDLTIPKIAQTLSSESYLITSWNTVIAQWNAVSFCWKSPLCDYLVVKVSENVDTFRLDDFMSKYLSKKLVLVGPLPGCQRKDTHLGELEETSKRLVMSRPFTFQGRIVSLDTWTCLKTHTQLQEHIKGSSILNLLHCKENKVGNLEKEFTKHYIPRTVRRKANEPAIAVDLIFHLMDHFVCITGEAGQGKTEFFKRIAFNTKQELPWMWVTIINFRHHTNHLEAAPSEELYRTCFLNTKKENCLEQDIFKLCVESGNILLLVDAFDEINPKYTNQCLSACLHLLKYFFKANSSSNKVEQTNTENFGYFWVSTRPITLNEVVTKLNLQQYSLNNFTHNDVAKFFKSVWENKSIEKVDEKVERFMELIIHKGHSLMQIVQIPLTAMMLVETCEDSNGNITVPEEIDLIEIYNSFTKKIIFRFLKDKMAIGSLDMNMVMSLHEDNCIKQHKILALWYIFSLQELEALTDKSIKKKATKFLSKFEEHAEKYGLIVLAGGNRTEFLHQTFAEYFTAQWIFDNFRHVKKDFFGEYYLSNSWPHMWMFFDLMYCSKNSLHKSIISGDMDSFMNNLNSADLNECDEGGRCPLHLAVLHLCKLSTSPQKVGVSAIPAAWQRLELLLDVGADTKIKDKLFEWTPLDYVEKFHHGQQADCRFQEDQEFLIDFLKRHGGDISTEDDEENASAHADHRLHAAAAKGQIRVMEELLDNGCDINSRNRNLRTALHVASLSGTEEVVMLLINRGADLTARDKQGWTALQDAARGGYVTFIREMLECARATDQKLDVDAKDGTGWTPLHAACYWGNVDCVDELLRQGADITNVDLDGWNALHLAADGGKVDCIRSLLSVTNQKGMKIDVNAITKEGRTALHYACHWGHESCVRYLLEAGADVNIANNDGLTPLSLAESRRNFNCVTIFQEWVNL